MDGFKSLVTQSPAFGRRNLKTVVENLDTFPYLLTQGEADIWAIITFLHFISGEKFFQIRIQRFIKIRTTP